jgi:diadenosine tetraphosphate (Ap4A) HIT family hydrolase
VTGPATSPRPCPFCSIDPDEVIDRNGPCLAVWTHESPDGSAMIVPAAHRETPWDLTPPEWTATHALLASLRDRLTATHAPDGWNIGWNVGATGGQSVAHVHCHLVPRYRDEAYAGRGLRWWLKAAENARTGT